MSEKKSEHLRWCDEVVEVHAPNSGAGHLEISSRSLRPRFNMTTGPSDNDRNRRDQPQDPKGGKSGGKVGELYTKESKRPWFFNYAYDLPILLCHSLSERLVDDENFGENFGPLAKTATLGISEETRRGVSPSNRSSSVTRSVSRNRRGKKSPSPTR